MATSSGPGAGVKIELLVERLAAFEHARWAHWQRYVHESGALQADGSLLIPAALVARWERQIAAKYEDLSEAEKNSDREQVRKYLPVIVKAFETPTAGSV
jgi:hypothetical protein